MPRTSRVAIGGLVYHVLNRANAGACIFGRPSDFEVFERILVEACQHIPMRVLAYCLLPNHWHMVLWPHGDGDLSAFMSWLGTTHVRRWLTAHDAAGIGHLYQGRFKSFPAQSGTHLLIVCRYVERNALRAGFVQRAEDWRWGSLWRRTHGSEQQKALLSDGPVAWPADWLEMVNRPQTNEEVETLRRCTAKGQPFGDDAWTRQTAQRLGLESTLRPQGRPRKRQ